MQRVWKMVPLRLGLEEHVAYQKGALQDRFFRNIEGTLPNISAWMRWLVEQRLFDLDIEIGERAYTSMTPAELALETQQAAADKAGRVRRKITSVDVGAFGGIPAVAPKCWHVPFGDFCKRCNQLRKPA